MPYGGGAEIENVKYGKSDIFNFNSTFLTYGTLPKKSIIEIFDMLHINKFH